MKTNVNLQRKLWLPVAALAGLGILMLFGVLKPAPKVNEDANLAPLVEVVDVQNRVLNPVIAGYGRAQPRESWAAISEVSGRVIYRHPDLEKGRSLPADTLVIKIDPVDYELAVAQSRSNLKSAELELERVSLNQKAYQQSRDIEQGRLEIARKELKRKEDLKKRGLISSSELEAQRNSTLAQEQSVWDLDSKLALIPTDKDVAQANVKVAQAQLKEAERSLARTEVILPFNARIGAVNVELDQVVNLQQTLLEAYDMALMEVTANMSLGDMRSLVEATSNQTIVPGQSFPDIRDFNLKAAVFLVIGDQTFEWQGQVDRIDDSIDADANTLGMTVQVENDLPNLNPQLSPPLLKDMYVRVEVTGTGKNLPVIPTKALHGNQLYLAQTDDTLKVQPVSVAYDRDGFSAIEGGLQVGDRVIVTDLLAPLSGMPVRVAGSQGETEQ